MVFTDPQVAAVGLTLQGALDQGVRAPAYDLASSETAGASFHARGTPDTSRIVVDEARAVLIGATFTGSDVADRLHAAEHRRGQRDPDRSSLGCGSRFPDAQQVFG